MAKVESGIKLTVDDRDLQKKFRNVEKSMDNLEKQVSELGDTTEREGKRMSDSMEKSAKSTLNFKNVLQSLGIYYGVQQLKDLALETINLGMQFERLGLAADTMGQKVGLSADDMVSAIQSGSEGAISKIDALQSANQALALNVIKSKDDLETLAEAAYSLGTAMGMGPTEAFNDLVTAMGRGSSKVLDNLGIVLKQEEAYQTYAAAIGKTVEALTEQEKQQAFAEAAMIKVRERLDELGPVQETSALQIDKMNASWRDFLTAAGRTVTITVELGGAVEALDWLADKMTKFSNAAIEGTEDLDTLSREVVAGSRTVDDYNQKVIALAQERGMPGLQKMLVMTAEQFDRVKSAMLAVDPVISKQVAAWRELEDAVAPEATKAMLPTMQRIADLTTYGIERNRAYVDGVKAMQGAYWAFGKDGEKALGGILKKQQEVDAAQREFASSMADYALGVQDIQVDMKVSGPDTASITEDANQERIENDQDLTDRLAQIEEDRQQKIHWVLTGAHARTQEENDAALAWWNAHYDALVAETMAGYEERNQVIDQKEAERIAAEQSRAAEQIAAQKAAMDELKLQAAISVLETQGLLGQFTEGMATSAGEAAKLVQAGLIDLSDPAKASMLVDALNTANVKLGEMAQTQQSNAPILDSILSGQVSAIDQIDQSAMKATQSLTTMAQQPLTGAEALGVGTAPPVPTVAPQMEAAATAAETLGQSVITSFDAWIAKVPEVVAGTDPIFTLLNTTLPKAYEDNNSKWEKSVDEMKSTVTDAKWADEVGKPIVEGIAKGITSNKQLANTAMAGLVNSMIAAAQAAAGVASPSTEGYYIGEQIALGLLQGLQSGKQPLSSEARSLMTDVFAAWEFNFRQAVEYGDRTSNDIKQRIANYIKEVTAIPGQTMGEMIERVWTLLQQRYARADDPMRRTLAELMTNNRNLIDDLIKQYGTGLAITTEDVLKNMFGFAGVTGSMAQTALGLQRMQSTARITALQEQLMLLDDQSTALADQQAILEDMEAERQRIATLEETSAQLQEQQAQLQFLQQQAQLIDMMTKYNLDPSQILGGVKLGLGADFQAVAEAMTRAMQVVIERADAELNLQHGGALTVPPGYPRDNYRIGVSSGERVVVTPAGTAPAGVSVTFGEVSINNGMDLAVFKALVIQTIRQASRV